MPYKPKFTPRHDRHDELFSNDRNGFYTRNKEVHKKNKTYYENLENPIPYRRKKPVRLNSKTFWWEET